MEVRKTDVGKADSAAESGTQFEVGERWRTLLHSHGLRYSRPREVILRFFGERDIHVSADELHHALHARGEQLSLSTVYLNLGVLRDAGLVREFAGMSGEALYDSNVYPHHHLICTRCGAVLDVPELEVKGDTFTAALQTHAERSSGWVISGAKVDLHGVCLACVDRTVKAKVRD